MDRPAIRLGARVRLGHHGFHRTDLRVHGARRNVDVNPQRGEEDLAHRAPRLQRGDARPAPLLLRERSGERRSRLRRAGRHRHLHLRSFAPLLRRPLLAGAHRDGPRRGDPLVAREPRLRGADVSAPPGMLGGGGQGHHAPESEGAHRGGLPLLGRHPRERPPGVRRRLPRLVRGAGSDVPRHDAARRAGMDRQDKTPRAGVEDARSRRRRPSAARRGDHPRLRHSHPHPPPRLKMKYRRFAQYRRKAQYRPFGQYCCD